MQGLGRVCRILFSAFVLSLALGCANGGRKETAGEYVDDALITSKVKAAFVKDKSLKASEIGVETHKGTVQLSGFVSDASDVMHAQDLAGSVKGVSSVK